MILAAESSRNLQECGGEAPPVEESGAVVVVGVKLDSQSRELLTWALVKVAHSGDRVIALHVLNPDADKSNLLSLVKNFDSLLAAYEGFCSLKQVDLTLKVCRGSRVRKILSKEAKSCGAASVVVGTSKVNHTIRSRVSVAKYCAKKLQKKVSVICVDNGKVLFLSQSSESGIGSVDALESRIQRKKTLSKSPLSLPPQRLLSSPDSGSQSMAMILAPTKKQEMPEYKSRWVLLRRVLLHGRRVSKAAYADKPTVVQCLSRTPSQQSIAATSTSSGDESLGLDEETGAIVLYSAEANSDAFLSESFSEELEGLREKYSTMCQQFSYQELLLATKNFSPENLIGKGGSSQVYRGPQPGGEEIAVKILKPSKDVLKHFISEIQLTTSVHHKNVISLLGFCFDENQLLLVYNFLSRGNLEENLYGTKKDRNVLGWPERYKVALGVAGALTCLHGTSDPIIHGDVKSSNILLADDCEPQLSDFGLATWASSCSHEIETCDVAGTFGYLAPEYFMHGKLNEKVDIYAFGVILLELLSGRKPIYNSLPKGQESLVMWAKHVLKEGKISELRDPNLVNAYNDDQFERMVLAATLCIQEIPQSRPAIETVSKLLEGEAEVIEWARRETSSSSKDINGMDGEQQQSATDIQSFINLALLNLEDDTTSVSSSEPNISMEDYLQGRWSRSSSFD